MENVYEDIGSSFFNNCILYQTTCIDTPQNKQAERNSITFFFPCINDQSTSELYPNAMKCAFIEFPQFRK